MRQTFLRVTCCLVWPLNRKGYSPLKYPKRRKESNSPGKEIKNKLIKQLLRFVGCTEGNYEMKQTWKKHTKERK